MPQAARRPGSIGDASRRAAKTHRQAHWTRSVQRKAQARRHAIHGASQVQTGTATP